VSPPFNLEFSPKIGVRESPELDGKHQSNIKGVYIIGDLADAPVIKMALRQGHEVAQYVWQQDLGAKSQPDPEVLDILIVGAGPAGVGAGMALQETGARFKLLEKDEPFATIAMFPSSKLIFSEPQSLSSPAGFWFEDASTKELLQRWGEILQERDLPIQNHCSVNGLSKSGGHFEVRCEDGSVHQAARVLLATGRRGTPRSLNVPGKDSEKVLYNLRDPKLHAGEKVLVVGGGDSAVETACDVADAGGQVTLSYRSPDFSRPKAKNKKRIQDYADQGKVKLELGTEVQQVNPESVTLKDGRELKNDRVFVQIGARLPTPFLEKLGLRMSGSMNALRAAWILGFGVLTWFFYLLKSGTEYSEQYGMHVAKKAFFPMGPEHILGFVPDMLRVDLGFREVDGAFWGTLIYSLLIVVFGVRAYRKYASSIQKKRYLSLMGFQLVFLFGIPELIAPAVIAIGGQGGLAWQIFGGDRAWKFYGLSVPWPLNIWGLIDAPSWSATGNTGVVVTWLLLSASVSFIAIPLFVWKHGERFCSWACGCGGLAETLGDLWRHLAPRGALSYQSEWAGRIIFALAIPTTALICIDAWGLLWEGLHSTKAFAQHWYPLMVDFWLASIVGVALYPYLGNRVWCRFFCPLRAYMELLARKFSTLTIQADDTCISCGECTRYCQMGIDVQSFAQRQIEMDNRNSACIQCGICVEVCPMDVLSIGERGQEIQLDAGSFAPAQGVCKAG
jgi:thioredoxin reductase/ferredoxin